MLRGLDMELSGKKIFISAAGAGMGYSVAKLALKCWRQSICNGS